MSSTLAPTEVPQPGDVIAGKYVVERVLGQGGMGVVVAARHRELDARVAIKLMRTRPAPSVESVERFQREARAAARLKSDHVARVTDVGQLDDGSPYMVLEHLEGADLAEIVRAGPVAPGLVAELVAQACEGVGEAHDHDIVHRDLKPSNLFVTRTVRGAARVKVLDFGISKLRGGGLDPMAETAQGAMLGTPLYMSPEQMRSSRDVDARTDVWSLGVVAFELLTGAVPWSTGNIAALALDVTTRPAPDPSAERPEIPAALAAVVLRCLEKEPGARFATAAELATALAPFRAQPSAAATDALLCRATGARGAIESAPTTPASATPAAISTPSTRSSPVSGRAATVSTPALAAPPPAALPRASSGWIPIALGVTLVGALAAGSMFLPGLRAPADPSVPAPAARTPASGLPGAADAALEPEPSAGGASGHAAERAPPNAGPAIESDLHPRPCLGVASPTCSEGTRPWCHPEGTRVACCGPGLVPTMDGLCDCPPGGATDEAAIASGCPAGDGSPTFVRETVRTAIRDHVPVFQRCYEDGLGANSALEGRLTLAFAASPWGEVWDARFDGSTLPSLPVQRCILAELRTMRLDPPLPGSNATLVTYPVMLGSGE